MRTTATNRKVRELITGIQDNTLIPRPEFQRRLVWSNKHKVAFVKTVLEGYPFPEIYVAAGDVDPDTGRGKEMLVDGQQRITTLYEYFRGSKELKLPKDFPAYGSLSKDQKIDFLEYDVVVRNLGQMEIPAIREIFTRINSTNYALNAMEIQNARYEGAFKKFGEALAGYKFFSEHQVFTRADVRRMHDLRFVLSVVVTIMETYFNRDDLLDDYLEKYNDFFPEKKQVFVELEQVFSCIREMEFDLKSRAWRKPDLFSIIVEVHRLIIREGEHLDPDAAGVKLQSFFDALSRITEGAEVSPTVSEYYKASIQATNDRSSRITRGRIIRKLLVEPAEQLPLIEPVDS